MILQQDFLCLQKVQRWMLDAFPGAYEVIFSNKYLLEMTDFGSNKGGMVKRLAARLGIPPGQIYCV